MSSEKNPNLDRFKNFMLTLSDRLDYCEKCEKFFVHDHCDDLEVLKKQPEKCVYHSNTSKSFDEVSSESSYEMVIMHHKGTQTENEQYNSVDTEEQARIKENMQIGSEYKFDIKTT
ncbi:1297_t:CDS:1, partial [Gigaspora rosea]